MLVLVFKVKSLHFVKVMVYKTNQTIYAIFHVLKYVRLGTEKPPMKKQPDTVKKRNFR